jgi:hypothetical protein
LKTNAEEQVVVEELTVEEQLTKDLAQEKISFKIVC